MILCRTIDVSDLKRDDFIETGGVVYKCKTFEPDGTGFTVIILEDQT